MGDKKKVKQRPTHLHSSQISCRILFHSVSRYIVVVGLCVDIENIKPEIDPNLILNGLENKVDDFIRSSTPLSRCDIRLALATSAWPLVSALSWN